MENFEQVMQQIEQSQQAQKTRVSGLINERKKKRKEMESAEIERDHAQEEHDRLTKRIKVLEKQLDEARKGKDSMEVALTAANTKCDAASRAFREANATFEASLTMQKSVAELLAAPAPGQ